MKNIQLVVSGLLALTACAVAGAEQPSRGPMLLAVESQSLDGALNAWSAQTGFQLLAPADRLTDAGAAPAVKGTYTPEGALKLLLTGADLTYEFVNRRTVALHSSKGAAVDGRIHLAQAQSSGAGESAASRETRAEGIEEVLVTAQKRSERLQDVPVPVTAIAAGPLAENNQVRLQDYYTRVPGLSITPFERGSAPQLIIRGITTGGGLNPTVSTVIDDIPYGASTSLGFGFMTPDIDPSELSRVEVLRGPQGTLYGASSIGGLLKFVTIDPSTAGLNGRMQIALNDVRNGDGTGYGVRGAVNVPLGETFAVRASGFKRRDAGYIDNVQTNQDGINQVDTSGGRVSALWQPSSDFFLKLGALRQRITADGSADVNPDVGDLRQSSLRDTGGSKKDIEAYSANLQAELGGVEITSLSGYSDNRLADSVDFTPAFGGFTQIVFGVGGAAYVERVDSTKFTQEIRASASIGDRFDWLVGGFYTNERSKAVQDLLASNVTTGAPVDSWVHIVFPTTYQEYAAFANLTVHFTERFDVQFGGRQSRNRQTYSQFEDGPFVPILFGLPTPLINEKVHTKDDSFTYLVTPRLRLSDDFMAYARLASGYRPGGPNLLSTAIGAPLAFEPDKTQTYEVGIKGGLFQKILSFDASVYYIDWKDIQLSLFNGATSYVGNGSGANSQGIELSVESSPRQGLRLSAWAAWNDAKLTQDFPVTSPAIGLSGDRLPYSSRISGSVSADQEFPFMGQATGFIGASVSYVGERKGEFLQVASPRQSLASYAQTDLRGGVRYDTWTVNLFVNNLTDRRGQLLGGTGRFPDPTAFRYIQPRTMGISLTKVF